MEKDYLKCVLERVCTHFDLYINIIVQYVPTKSFQPDRVKKFIKTLTGLKNCHISAQCKMENDTVYLETTNGVDFKTQTFPRYLIYSRYCLDEENPYTQFFMYFLFGMSYAMFVEAAFLISYCVMFSDWMFT